MNYETLYDYATKHHLSYNELCTTVNKAAESDQYALDACRQELARLYNINQKLIGNMRKATASIKTLERKQPIPDHIIVTLYAEQPQCDADMIEFAREIEQLHGITE